MSVVLSPSTIELVSLWGFCDAGVPGVGRTLDLSQKMYSLRVVKKTLQPWEGAKFLVQRIGLKQRVFQSCCQEFCTLLAALTSQRQTEELNVCITPPRTTLDLDRKINREEICSRQTCWGNWRTPLWPPSKVTNFLQVWSTINKMQNQPKTMKDTSTALASLLTLLRTSVASDVAHNVEMQW